MNKSELIKELINKTGLSMKAFAIQADIPYTTLRSMLERSIENASVNNVLKVCSALNITIEELYNISKRDNLTNEENELLSCFNSLNNTGKKELLKRASELKLVPNYTHKSENFNDSGVSSLPHINKEKYSTFESNEHIGMAAHNDYATDPEQLLLMQEDLDEL